MASIFENTHIRINILTGEQVLVSPHRTKRPWQGKIEKKEPVEVIVYDKDCYLCPKNKRVNGEINPDYEDTFVFVNDFSALTPNKKTKTYRDGLLKAIPESGMCKVICYSPNHSLTFAKMSINKIAQVIKCWILEFKTLSKKKNVNNIQIFENKGQIMGCSNPHPHGQIWAQKSIPNSIQQKTNRFKEYINYNNKTLLEDYIEQELESDERVIYHNEDFVVLVPFWAIWPYETMIIPKKSAKNIAHLTKNEIINFAKSIKTLSLIYDNIFNVSFPYSSGIHQAPVDDENNKGWHWHMCFYPPLLRSATVKKFMVGYEMFAMPQRDITPEVSAKLLRAVYKKTKV